MAFLSNSLQQLKREDGKQRLQQRKVMLLNSRATFQKNKMLVGTLWLDFFILSLSEVLLFCYFQVLKLHPVLAPVKVALDIGRGATMELRQV